MSAALTKTFYWVNWLFDLAERGIHAGLAVLIECSSTVLGGRAPSCLKFDRFEWFGDEVGASVGGV